MGVDLVDELVVGRIKLLCLPPPPMAAKDILEEVVVGCLLTGLFDATLELLILLVEEFCWPGAFRG